ncbi:MAG: RDD family protein [Armatimonadota bacterium]
METPTPSLREQGIQALKEGALDRAIDLLARAVMANDNDADAKAFLGVAYSQKGLHAQAKRALQTAVELQPQNANYQYNLGVALERAGDMQGAAVAYRDALQLNKDHAQARAKLQAMGPAAQQLLANAPKPVPPVGVPTYNTPPSQPTQPTQPPAPPSPGGYAPPPPPMPGPPGAVPGPGYAPPHGDPLAQGAPPGTVQCPSCGQFSQPGISCEWCSGALAAPAPAPAAPAYGPAAQPGGFHAQPYGAYGMAPSMTSGEAFGRRLGAALIDNILLSIIIYGLLFGAGFTIMSSVGPGGEPSTGQAALLGYLLYINPYVLMALYFGAMYASRGQSLGKMATGIRVVGPDGDNPGFFRGAFRDSLGKAISGICLLGYLWMLWDPEQQTWHDKIFGTHVERA